MKTIVVTDVLAADLVAKNEAEYASGDVHLEAPLPAHAAALLPPVTMRNENGKRVDQPCPPGTPGTVTLSATGHTLSNANPWNGTSGEMFVGYCERVWRQAMGDPSSLGFAMQDTTPWFSKFGGFKKDGSNWPQAADFFYDTMAKRGSYLTDDEKRAQEAAAHQWADVGKAIGENAQQPPAQVPQQPVPQQPEVPLQPETQVITHADVGDVTSVVGETEVPLQPSQA